MNKGVRVKNKIKIEKKVHQFDITTVSCCYYFVVYISLT